MTDDDNRYRISREEIGVMLSFAKRPHAVTQEWMRRLQAGVSRDELLEFFALADLPLSEASRIMASDTKNGIPVDDEWSARSAGYRRAVVGVLLIYIVLAVALNIAAGETPFAVLVLAATLVGSGFLMHRVLVRLSAGMG